ncbi:MAG: glycosyl transferase [Deltaproteobacteria bacterium HGW-Deltaproteobacteria-13]|jgi:SAM-dependent methyltransferase|nr:MAG: glycosyl transferase [Deltaproteobacteria bacterium HGW-Deltaproteobacteria-13]
MDYKSKRTSHWNQIAVKTAKWNRCNAYYHKRLQDVFRFVIPPGQRIIEIGCGKGDLLAFLKPSYGVGVDFSDEMIRLAEGRHPDLHFVQADAHEIDLKDKFDFVILSDVVNELWDVQTVFQKVLALTTPRSRIIINFYSRLWELPLGVIRKLGLAKPMLLQNWLTAEDMKGLLSLAGFEVIRHWDEIIWPVRTPVIDSLLNHFIVKIWPFNLFALTHFMVAKPCASCSSVKELPKVSVIIPARNEAGNINRIFDMVPEMGRETELIFVEGGSTDDTYSVIQKAIANNPQRVAKLLRQSGKGKGDAVRLGFNQSRGDILMILDADLTVPPEDLPRFYDALQRGKAEFINGVRLVYPMEKEAMRFLNLLGNKFFSLVFSWLLGQPVKDTLCGTKALWKTDYERIAANRSYFGDFDPFGDFDLLFGAAKLNLKIIEVPIRYRERTYGTTNISRWKHGWLLLRMVIFALRRIKFV